MRRWMAGAGIMVGLMAGVALGQDPGRTLVVKIPGGADEAMRPLVEALVKEQNTADGKGIRVLRAQSSGKGEVEVHLAAQKGLGPAREEMQVKAVAARVGPVWEKVVEKRREEMEKWQGNLESARERVEKGRAELKAAEGKMQESTGRIDLSIEGMRAAKDALEIERQKVELDLAGLAARRAALEEAVAEQAIKAKMGAEKDLAVVAMRKAVEAAKENVNRTRKMFEAGSVSTTEMSRAEYEALEVEARLAERMNSAGGSAEAMAAWNRELTNAAIEQREKEARLKAATRRLEMLVEASRAGSELRRLQEQVEALEMDLKGSEERLQKANDWLKEYGDLRPVVEVKGESEGKR